MEISPQKITVDINRDDCYQMLIVKQGDRNSRFIEITLTQDGFKIELADIASEAVFSASNKGRLVQNEAFEIKDNHTVLVALSENALAESGALECELSAIKGDDKVTSGTFIVVVAESTKGKHNSITDMLKGVVSTEMLKKGAVNNDKLADGAVTGKKIADRTIGPEKLLKIYREFSTATVRGYSDLDSLIESDGAEKIYFKLDISGLAPFYGVIGEGGVYAEVTGDTLTLHNNSSGKSWLYHKGVEKLTETLSNKMNTADTFTRITTLGDNANPELLAYQTDSPTTPPMIRIPLSVLMEKVDKAVEGYIAFVNLGVVADAKRLDAALSKHNSDTSKMYRFDLGDDIYGDNYIIPAGVYIGYVTGWAEDGRVLQFESVPYDGIKRTLLLDTGIPNVYDYYEETIVTKSVSEDTSPNCHAEYFNVTDDGELSVKAEYAESLPADLVIPEVVNEIVVDRLPSKMLYNNKQIESITFPATIDAIPAECFNQAVNLRHLYNTEHIKSIGEKAFRFTRIEKAVFPNLETLGASAFTNVSHLAYVNVGKVTNIEGKTFKHCFYLSKFVGDNVATVGAEAFMNTARLQNADFADKITSVGDYAFWVTKLEYDWSGASGLSSNATYAQVNPTDFWSGVPFTPCENPTPTELCQRNPEWANTKFYNSAYTYGAQGCLIMSAIHAVCGIHNIAVSSPAEFCELVGNENLFDSFTAQMSNIGTVLDNIPNDKYKVTATIYPVFNKSNLRLLYDTLSNGGYAIVQVGAPNDHGILIYGITDAGELMCLDSERRYPYDETKPIRYKLPFNKLVAPNTTFVTITR